MLVHCGVCGRERDRTMCEIVELTPEEISQLEDKGISYLKEYIYCKPCWRILTNPEISLEFMKGLFRVQLSGGLEADKLSEKYLDSLKRLRPVP